MKSTLFAMLAVMTMIFSMTGLHIDSAWSADLRSAKAAGQIGEQPDGYLGIVSSASADVQALVSDINQKRRDAYQGIANSNGTSLNAVEILAGKKAIEKTPAGEYVRTAAGEWIKK
ncbi:MAG: DUF1318 domain-containing protein [Zetaproteobacteria bacterium CG_4_9_14_3_um_filter_49_83]|nr:MAG: hypothetical protein AUJ56_00575 [Zetaproteobacteria bacterium CG1_02_49_23]PIQ31567.1 MAG: hypothetical protein COW62_09645 [Zetaproteobacteria bacterium CG17_big_fil_post_rev_8_21_14_2_50_50_13]PIV29697.1 MAG: DUF1318 domain-containing protein [Zetaproteobacteria bacterium CG02_land_8_20_14_3_00_50_9]PIY54676.1 MAG: DUF1318 domain-containing protein [Zetaproteobacteria bacterium CG_4_10_14_0_8_um_filter_49_80]PJA35717.1 MAG: DUF1318 domain-containing protein [Zetaproteobacteria bacter